VSKDNDTPTGLQSEYVKFVSVMSCVRYVSVVVVCISLMMDADSRVCVAAAGRQCCSEPLLTDGLQQFTMEQSGNRRKTTWYQSDHIVLFTNDADKQ